MSAWAEKLVANVNIMKKVRDTHEKNKVKQKINARTREQFEKDNLMVTISKRTHNYIYFA